MFNDVILVMKGRLPLVVLIITGFTIFRKTGTSDKHIYCKLFFY